MKNGSNTSDNAQEKGQKAEDRLFDPEKYEKHKGTIAVLMGRHMLRHLLLLYKKFEGDLLLAVVLGEIGHHNVGNIYSQEGNCLKPRSDLPAGPERLKYLDPTNAFSISESTGIPRETVRRKISKLLERGWITKGSRGEVALTETASDFFTKDFNKELLAEFLIASECINDLLK